MRDYRRAFPFPVGTTSYILPVEEDNLIRNVDFLKDKVDKVQLLLFGRNYLEEMLSGGIVSRLRDLQSDSGLAYSLHLPLDLELLHTEKALRESVSCIEHILGKTEALLISDYILHLDSPEMKGRDVDTEDYHQSFCRALQEITSHFPQQSRRFRIENTFYDLSVFSREIERFDYSVCLDIGHLALLGLPLQKMVRRFRNRIDEVHIHGYAEGQDHQSLALLDDASLTEMVRFLKENARSAIVEVFNESDLESSMETLLQAW